MHLSTLSLVGSALPLALASEGYMHLPVSKRASQGVPRSKRDLDFNTGLYNNQNEYIINITVGTPPQNLGVTLDTGSADLWVPAVSSKPCESGKCDFGSFDPKKSSSYNIIDEGGFNITYAAAGDYDAGNWVEESVTVGSSSTINNTIIGVALNGADQHGVLGVGYDTNEAQPNPSKNGSYPNVLDHMVSEGLLNRKAYGLYLNDINATDGSICFGCVDTTKYTGDLVALPLQLPDAGAALDPNIPNAFYVTITQVAFIDAAGKETVVSPDDYAQSALLDSGTSLTYINADVFSSLATGLGALQVGSGNYFVPCSYANSNATIRYTFGGEGGPQIDIPMSSVIFGDDIPSSEFKSETGDDGCALGMAGPSGDVVLGDTFLRNAYIVYDLDNYQVAIAQAKVGQASTSSLVVIPTGTDIPGVSSTATATGTQLNSAALTAVPTGISAAGSTASSFSAPTPTFNLGGQATSSGAKGTGVESTSSSSSKGAAPTAGPQAAMLGVLAAGALFL